MKHNSLLCSTLTIRFKLCVSLSTVFEQTPKSKLFCQLPIDPLGQISEKIIFFHMLTSERLKKPKLVLQDLHHEPSAMGTAKATVPRHSTRSHLEVSCSDLTRNPRLSKSSFSVQDLYHELLAMDTVNASLRRTQAEEEQFPGTQKGEPL
jgi:hypothetical protein